MRIPRLSLFALFAWGGVTIPACSQATEPSRFQYTPNVNSILGERWNAAGYKVLHSFKNAPDGAGPAGGLIDVGGTFYGTTLNGGAFARSGKGLGTVFRLTGGGAEKVVHSFGKGADGYGPAAGLIGVGSTYYGTTQGGGAYNYHPYYGGTVFSITTSGKEKVLHSFGEGYDGARPEAALVYLSGSLYGTTELGGHSYLSYGTVFSITKSGTEKVLHTFGKGNDGFAPAAALIAVSGTLYGTTSAGGGASNCGVVFSITTPGREKVLHAFKGSDGCDPVARVIDVNGTLYGTTAEGGAYCAPLGCGTVFSLTTAGTEKVLHSFGKGTDGQVPAAALIEVNGALYGTTEYGGTYGGSACAAYHYEFTGCGTVFSITTGGSEAVLHSFASNPDGAHPVATLFNKSGTLVGTTLNGGTYGYGTVFSLTP